MALDSFQNINLNVNWVNHVVTPTPIYAVNEGDVSGRNLVFHITNQGQAVDLSGYTGGLYWKHERLLTSGMGAIDTTLASTGIITALIPQSLQAESGDVRVNLRLTNKTTEQAFATRTFIIRVENSGININAIQDSDQFSALDKALQEVGTGGGGSSADLSALSSAVGSNSAKIASNTSAISSVASNTAKNSIAASYASSVASSVAADMDNVTSSVSSLQAVDSSLSSGQDSQDTRMSSMDSDVAHASLQASAAASEVADYSSSLASLSSGQDSQDSRFVITESNVSDNQHSIATLSSAFETLVAGSGDATLDGLQAQVNILSSNAVQSGSNISVNQSSIASLALDLSTTKSDQSVYLSSLAVVTSTNSSEIASISPSLADLTSSMSSAGTAISSLASTESQHSTQISNVSRTATSANSLANSLAVASVEFARLDEDNEFVGTNTFDEPIHGDLVGNADTATQAVEADTLVPYNIASLADLNLNSARANVMTASGATTPGLFLITAKNQTSLVNAPWTGSVTDSGSRTFTLLCRTNSDGTVQSQTLIDDSSGNQYNRGYNNGAWSAWVADATETDITAVQSSAAVNASAIASLASEVASASGGSLPSNVATLPASQTFTGANTFTQNITGLATGQYSKPIASGTDLNSLTSAGSYQIYGSGDNYANSPSETQGHSISGTLTMTDISTPVAASSTMSIAMGRQDLTVDTNGTVKHFFRFVGNIYVNGTLSQTVFDQWQRYVAVGVGDQAADDFEIYNVNVRAANAQIATHATSQDIDTAYTNMYAMTGDTITGTEPPFSKPYFVSVLSYDSDNDLTSAISNGNVIQVAYSADGKIATRNSYNGTFGAWTVVSGGGGSTSTPTTLASSVIAATDNLNNYTETGVYYCDAPSAVQNQPNYLGVTGAMGTDPFVLTVTSSADKSTQSDPKNGTYQRFVLGSRTDVINSPNVYARIYESGAWQPWFIEGSGDIPWTELTLNTAAFTDSSSTFNISVGSGGYRANGVVYLRLNLKTAASISAYSNTEVCQLPRGFYPSISSALMSDQIGTPAIPYNAGNTNAGMFWIKSDGTLQYSNGTSTASGVTLSASLVFPVSM